MFLLSLTRAEKREANKKISSQDRFFADFIARRDTLIEINLTSRFFVTS